MAGLMLLVAGCSGGSGRPNGDPYHIYPLYTSAGGYMFRYGPGG